MKHKKAILHTGCCGNIQLLNQLTEAVEDPADDENCDSLAFTYYSLVPFRSFHDEESNDQVPYFHFNDFVSFVLIVNK